MIRAWLSHWFPLIRPAIKPVFLRCRLGGVRFTSHDFSEDKTQSGDSVNRVGFLFAARKDTGPKTNKSLKRGHFKRNFHIPNHQFSGFSGVAQKLVIFE